MLIVTGRLEINAEDVPQARAAIQTMMEETQKEAGCHVYEFGQIVGSDTMFRVYEEWDDEAALAAHIKAPHMGVFRAALGELRIISRDIAKFDGGEKQSLG